MAKILIIRLLAGGQEKNMKNLLKVCLLFLLSDSNSIKDIQNLYYENF